MKTSFISHAPRVAALAAAAFTCLALTACGGGSGSEPAAVITPPVVTPTTPADPNQPAAAPQIRCAP